MNNDNQIGYLEEFYVVGTNKFLGGRQLKTLPAGRVPGYQGQQVITITEDITLDHNYNPKTLRAKGQQVISMIITLHGKKPWRDNEMGDNGIAVDAIKSKPGTTGTGSLATPI